MSHCFAGADGACWKHLSLWSDYEQNMIALLSKLWSRDEGQDIAEYAVMLAVVLAIVIGTVRLIGSGANTVFSGVASAIQ